MRGFLLFMALSPRYLHITSKKVVNFVKENQAT